MQRPFAGSNVVKTIALMLCRKPRQWALNPVRSLKIIPNWHGEYFILASILTCFFSMIFMPLVFSQHPCDLIATSPIHDCIDTLKNVQYGTGRHDYDFPDPANGCTPAEPLFTDIFSPCEMAATPRPLVIFVHGGGFAAGNKADFWAQCDAFAQRGYTAATISYRLSINPLTLSRNSLIRAGYRAMQDAKCAVRYFKAHANEYNIDTAHIYLLGYSAGAVTVLNVAFARDVEEKPAETGFDGSCGYWFGCPFCPDLGTLEGDGGWPGHTSEVNGILSLAGAVMDMSLIDTYDDVPVWMVHGTEDQTVDYDSACYLNLSPCPKLYGSHSIQQRAEELGLCSSLFTIEGAGHDVTPYNDTILAQAVAFFNGLVCQGNPCNVNFAADNRAKAAFKVFPNPVGDYLQIEWPVESSGRIALQNLEGKVLFEKNMKTTGKNIIIPAGGIPPGFYFLKWTSSKDNTLEAYKLVKK